MEAVVPLSPYNKQIKAQKNRHSRSVNLFRAQSGIHAPMSTFNYYPKWDTFSVGNQQPPLLPLPFVVPKAAQQAPNFSPTKKKEHNLTRHQSLISPRKSTPSKSQILQQPDKITPLGPHPNGLPRVKFMDGGRSASPSVDKFFAGESVFMMAPPPSSLPLPRFSLRPKRSCTAEAAGVDAGATDGLRRILRLA